MDKCRVILTLTFVIAALWTNQTQAAAPIIYNLPTIVYVGETENTVRPLYFYNISDPDGNSYICTNTITGSPGTDSDDEFELRWNTLTSRYELWVTTLTAFTYATITSYDNVVVCTDSNGQASTALTLQVDVVEGEKVTVYNADVTIAASTTGIGAFIETVSSISTAGNDIRYSLTSEPSYTPEYFIVDSSTGIITANRELKYIDASTPIVYLIVSAFDSVNHILVYNNITVTLSNQNTIPTTTTLPATASTPENVASGTTLFTLSTVDIDTTDSHTYRFTCDPTTGASIFTIDTAGVFSVASGQTVDYESSTSYNCSFYISDGLHEGGPFTYLLTVNDVNEAPSFTRTTYYGYIDEGAQGSTTFNPSFTCTDPDASDTTTFSLESSTDGNRFRILMSGEMTFNVDYDVDNGNMPTSAVFKVYCVDSGPLTGTATVSITIADINDNAPTFPSTSYSMLVSSTNSAGDVIGTITATDADSGSNGEFTCSGTSTSAYSTYFSVGFSCQVFLTRTIDFTSNTYVSYIAYATDKGSPQMTGTTGIDILYTEVTTTTTAATTTEYNFFDHDGNVALFVITLLLGLALLALITWCLVTRYCNRNPCCELSDICQDRRRRRPLRRLRPITPEETVKKREKPPPPKVYEEPEPDVSNPVNPRPPPANSPGYWRGPPVRPVPGVRGYPRFQGPPSLPGYYR